MHPSKPCPDTLKSRSIIEASGMVLSDSLCLPENYTSLEQDALDRFLLDNVSCEYENFPIESLWAKIEELAQFALSFYTSIDQIVSDFSEDTLKTADNCDFPYATLVEQISKANAVKCVFDFDSENVKDVSQILSPAELLDTLQLSGALSICINNDTHHLYSYWEALSQDDVLALMEDVKTSIESSVLEFYSLIANPTKPVSEARADETIRLNHAM